MERGDQEGSERLRFRSGRLAALKEVARVALWLCTEEASYVTGSELIVDGGASIYAG